jgi:hypothetical protein
MKLPLIAVAAMLLLSASATIAAEPASTGEPSLRQVSRPLPPLVEPILLVVASDSVESPAKGRIEAAAVTSAGGPPTSASDQNPAGVPRKGPPLPLHTIEGTGGILTTPTAYLVNPGPKDSLFGKPAVSVTHVGARRKNIQTLALTETLFGRLELGYGLSRFGLGTLRDNVKDATGVDIKRDDVYLHNLNARLLILEENSFDLPLPAITAGVHFKINDGIDSINHHLGGALEAAGITHSSGVDYTLTASKTFGNVFGRPLITSAGLRFSKASQLGYLGFNNAYHASFESNLAYLVTNWLAVAYEFRQKINGYDNIGKLVQKEENWQTVGLGFVINQNLTATIGWGRFGDVLDTTENGGWAVQLKYEF